jgi:hypothetical protein
MRTNTQNDSAQNPVPEARYAYYRRCQVFRKGGEQCKAPAEKGSHICYAHAGQMATAFRRDMERQIVLAEAVAEMRRRGKPDCEMADLFMDFKSINMTLAVMTKALIAGRIDCKTAGKLVVQLQTMSKLLWIQHRGTQRTATALTAKDTKKHEARKTTPLINTDNTDLQKAAANLTEEALRRGGKTGGRNCSANDWVANEREQMRISLVTEVLAIANKRGWAHAPPELLSAA